MQSTLYPIVSLLTLMTSGSLATAQTPQTESPQLDPAPDQPLLLLTDRCLDSPDTDGDNVLDCMDSCPNDPLKILPGICGCDLPDDDTDGDGVADCHEECDLDPFKREPGVCGCGEDDFDSDGDSVPDCVDACPNDAGKSILEGPCGCGTPDTDSDADSIPNCLDNCPAVFNPIQVDIDSDGIGDACEAGPAAPDDSILGDDTLLSGQPGIVDANADDGAVCCGFGIAPAVIMVFWGLCMARGKRARQLKSAK